MNLKVEDYIESKYAIKTIGVNYKTLINKDQSGAYVLWHVASGFIYIGSTNSYKNRYWGHITALRKNKHTNPKLQKIYNNYNNKDFIMYVFPTNEYKLLEQQLLDIFKDKEYLCNISKSAYGNYGVKQSKENIEKIRTFNLNKYKLKENRIATGNSIRKTYENDPTLRIKKSIQMKEICKRPEIIKSKKNRMKNFWKLDEFRNKTIKAIKETKNTPEYKEKQSLILKKVFSTEEAKQRRSKQIRKLFEDVDFKENNRIRLLEYNRKKSNSIIINGIEYESVRTASRITGENRGTMIKKLNDITNNNYSYK